MRVIIKKLQFRQLLTKQLICFLIYLFKTVTYVAVTTICMFQVVKLAYKKTILGKILQKSFHLFYSYLDGHNLFETKQNREIYVEVVYLVNTHYIFRKFRTKYNDNKPSHNTQPTLE
jgi:hypothetical protein